MRHIRMKGRMPVSPGKRSFLGPARVKHDLFYVNAPASPETRRFFGLLPEPFKQIIHGEHNMKNYRRGLAAGIPIALGYLSVSFTFGILRTCLAAGSPDFYDDRHFCRTICRHRNNDASRSVHPDADLTDYNQYPLFVYVHLNRSESRFQIQRHLSLAARLYDDL